MFAQHNVQTVMGTAQAAGVAMLVAARHGIPVTLHTPSEVKAAITGSGRAAKDQVGTMVTRILRLDETPDAGRRGGRVGAGHLPRLAGRRRPAGLGWRPPRPRRPDRRLRGPQSEAPMIAQLTGTVLQVGPTSAVVEVGGLGVLALCSPDTAASLRVGQRATLATSLIVREDSLTLYGFASHDEREFFELLQTATGVGPKLAQAALAVLSPDELRSAIATENLVQL